MESQQNFSKKLEKFAHVLAEKLLGFLATDPYKTIVVLSNKGSIKINDGQSRKVLAVMDFNDVNNGGLDNTLKTLKKRQVRTRFIAKESDTLKSKILQQQEEIENLYSRIRELENEQQTFQKSASPRESGDARIDELQKKISLLREENYCLRESEDSDRALEHNSISFFEHRLKNAIISQIAHKIGTDLHRHQLLKFTTKELFLLNHSEPHIISELLSQTEADLHLLRRDGVERLIKTIRRRQDELKIIHKFHIQDPALLAKLNNLTNNALKFLRMLPEEKQAELLDQLPRLPHDRIWNGAFIKGYYFLTQLLSQSPQEPFFLKDVRLNSEGSASKILFKETVYEIFGNFIFIDKQQLYVTSGIGGMAKMLKDQKHESIIKGLLGELMAAYYFKKAYEMEILELQKKIDTVQGTVGEIDIIAIDKQHVLWDIEVKNWHITSLAASETLIAKVTEQLRGRERMRFMQTLKSEYERLRGIKINAIRQRAILVKDTPYKPHLQKLQTDSNILLDVVDLVPDWLTKGIYAP